MPLTICFYEDNAFSQFLPLTHLRPVCALRNGMTPLFGRARRFFDEPNICLTARDSVSPLIAEQHRDVAVNIIKRTENSDVLFLNGRIRDYGNLPEAVQSARVTTRYVQGEQTIAVLFKHLLVKALPVVAMPSAYFDEFERSRQDVAVAETNSRLYNYSWEIMADIEREVTADFAFYRKTFTKSTHRVAAGAYFIKSEDTFMADGADLMPGSVFDASKGPIYIGANTIVEPHAVIYGPTSIGANSIVYRGKIATSSIGDVCRVGGEIEESVFHSYVNKHHDGFIGHSYVCPWVNFGALTTNSDLKNNYSPIRLMINSRAVDTGALKVGAFIGDHTKFGIGTLLNTGINIGICCNIFGGTLITEKEIASFKWGNSAMWKNYDLDKALDTAKRTVERRGQRLSEREIAVLSGVFNNATDTKGIAPF